MNTTLLDIDERLTHIEHEVTNLRGQLIELRQLSRTNGMDQAGNVQPLMVDKTELKRYMDDLFATHGIKGKPVGAKVLQQMMKEAGLEETELSRGIIAMREE